MTSTVRIASGSGRSSRARILAAVALAAAGCLLAGAGNLALSLELRRLHAAERGWTDARKELSESKRSLNAARAENERLRKSLTGARQMIRAMEPAPPALPARQGATGGTPAVRRNRASGTSAYRRNRSSGSSPFRRYRAGRTARP